MMKVILVAGGSGFIGSNFIKYFLRRNKAFIIVNIDKLTYGSNPESLNDLEDSPRYHFVKGDICNQELVNYIVKRYKPDFIINCAGETHENRSLEHPGLFSQTNIMGTLTLLEAARQVWSKKNFSGNRFIQMSTDQVYGENRSSDFYSEEASLAPTNPYAASKAAADMLVQSYWTSYSLPAITARCCSVYGPGQHKDKFIPACINSALQDKPIPLYRGGELTREWIHVLDLSVALIRTIFYGKSGEIYNIGSGEEATNLTVARKILKILGKPEEAISSQESSFRFDSRYGLNSYKVRNALSWSSKYSLDDGLKDTVRWYLQK